MLPCTVQLKAGVLLQPVGEGAKRLDGTSVDSSGSIV
jgi:hypothetical protein